MDRQRRRESQGWSPGHVGAQPLDRPRQRYNARVYSVYPSTADRIANDIRPMALPNPDAPGPGTTPTG